jgi:hypothetical protein
MKTAIILLLLAGCAAAPSTPPPANTPPPPIRPENAVDINGTVIDAAGTPVPGARVTASECDGSNRVSHVSGADGSYELRVERSVGPQVDGCIAVEAAAGGSTVRNELGARFARGSAVRMDLRLPQAPFLNRLDADRLIETLQREMQGDQDALAELKLYIPGAPTSLTPIARYTRGIDSFRVVEEGDRRLVYELKGRRPERTVRVTVWQDTLTRVALPEIEESGAALRKRAGASGASRLSPMSRES